LCLRPLVLLRFTLLFLYPFIVSPMNSSLSLR
jgi:hypothetical protein